MIKYDFRKLKTCFVLVLVFALTVSVFAGCSGGNKNDTDDGSTQTDAQTDIQQNSDDDNNISEEPKDVLVGFADNQSYEVNTENKTYDIYKDLVIEGTFEDMIAVLQNSGLEELRAPEENVFGGYDVEYGFQDEYDYCYVKLSSEGDMADYLYYVSYNYTETGFHASDEVYDVMCDRMDEDVTTLSQVEEYFGKGFMQNQSLESDGSITYEYAWSNAKDMIWCFADSEGNLVGYKISCTNLPEVYGVADVVDNGLEEDNTNVLEGFADNTSYDAYTDTVTYTMYEQIELYSTFEETVQLMLDNGLEELTEPYEWYENIMLGQYGYWDEYSTCYIEIVSTEDGEVDRLTYWIFTSEDTGFEASEAVFNELQSKVDSGDITMLSQIEEYFGEGYIRQQTKTSDGSIIYEYTWSDEDSDIWCFVDSNGNLVDEMLDYRGLQ